MAVILFVKKTNRNIAKNCHCTIARKNHDFVLTMGDCRNSSICSNVQMFKYPNIWIFQTSAKSLPNLEICDFFVKLWKKVDMSRQADFCPNFVSYSDLCQTSKYSNILHTCSCIRRPIPTIHLLMSHFPGRL